MARMNQELVQRPKMNQKMSQTLNQHQAQFLELLQTPVAELDRLLSATCESNVFLDRVDSDLAAGPDDGDPEFANDGDPEFGERLEKLDGRIDEPVAGRESAEARPAVGATRNRDPHDPTHTTAVDLAVNEETLADKLRLQAMLDLAPRDQRIAEAIIGNMSERGYLCASIGDIQGLAPAGTTWKARTIERVRREILRFEPVGTASLDCRECLQAQVESAGIVNPLLDQAIEQHLETLEARDGEALAQALGCDMDAAREVLRCFRRLDPAPGLAFVRDPSSEAPPEIALDRVGTSWQPRLTVRGLRLHTEYRALIANAGVDATEAEKFSQQWRQASRLHRTYTGVESTLRRFAQLFVDFQAGFLEHGPEHIAAQTYKMYADRMGCAESTICRLVKGRTIGTPWGVIPLRAFFHSTLETDQGEISSFAVKCKIRRWISRENPDRPLSDPQLLRRLRADGIRVAERTVTNYRNEMGLPTFSERRQLAKKRFFT